MYSTTIKPYKRLAIIVTLVLAAIFTLLLNSQAAGQPRDSELALPANSQASENAIDKLGIGQDHPAKQPPGLVGKPQNHLAPPEQTPPNTVPPQDGVPPDSPQPGEVPPVIPPPVINPKIPRCPMFVGGNDSSTYEKCNPCRYAQTADGAYNCPTE